MFTYNVNIGLAIEQRMNELNLTKSELGRRIGVPQQNVNRILNKPDIDTDKLTRICKALDFNFFTLYCDDAAASSTAVINSANSNAAGRDVSIIHQASSEEAALLRRLCDEKDERIKELKERIEELKQMLHTALAK